jgi:hypothetical protein
MASSRERGPGGLRRVAAEQAALRRVAMLAAGGAPAEEVFAAVAAEAGRVLQADRVWIARYESDQGVRVVAAWASTDAAAPTRVGTRVSIGGQNVSTLVLQTGRPARIDDYAGASGPAAEVARESGVTLALQVRAAQAAPPEGGELIQWLDSVAAGLTGVLEELREIARGLHPAVLAERGLGPALEALARRSLVGLRDRAEALGGRLSLHSPSGAGTTLQAELPLTATAGLTSRQPQASPRGARHPPAPTPQAG